VAFSPDGKLLATGGSGTVQVWNAATGHEIGGTLRTGVYGGTDSTTSMTFSPDSRLLATGNADGSVRIWDLAESKQIDGGPLVSGAGPVDSVAFSPDGNTLAAASSDGSVRLWDVLTGQQIGSPLTQSAGPVNSVAFSPDGRTLTVASSDGSVRLWDTSYLVDTLKQICSQVGSALTQNSWGLYVPPGPAYRNACP
jgi:WD40 repeat protein